jgi:hyperosmotically inducible periplasmic protein
MRFARLAILIPFALAACDSAEPPKPVELPAPKPMAQAPAPAPSPPPAPAAAPRASPDELLAERVRKALRDARDVDGQGVDVGAANGEVTLYGTVPSAAERRKIATFVARIEGVRSVVNKLVVVQGS